MYKVYEHTFPNGKKYIGITKLTVENRWRSGKGYKNQDLMYRAINKYGWDNIKHEVLFDNLTKEEAEQREIELIAKYKTNNKKFGYNIENGGNCKGKMSEEEKLKRSKRFKGKNNPMYGKEGLCGEKNPMYGKKWTDEQKKAHSEKLKGKLVGKKNPMYGKKHTAEFKEHLSKLETGANNPNAKAVICMDTGIIYPCATIASEMLGISSGSISQCCHGRIKTAGGYKWKLFKEEAYCELV